MANDLTRLSDFVKVVLNDKSNEQKKCIIASVSEQEAIRLYAQTGYKCAGYTHVIDNYSVKHVATRHFNIQTEFRKGLIAITINDFDLIPDIIATPDKVYNGGKSKLGKDVIIYEKRVNGYIVFMEEIRANRKELALLTIYKKKAGS